MMALRMAIRLGECRVCRQSSDAEQRETARALGRLFGVAPYGECIGCGMEPPDVRDRGYRRRWRALAAKRAPAPEPK